MPDQNDVPVTHAADREAAGETPAPSDGHSDLPTSHLAVAEANRGEAMAQATSAPSLTADLHAEIEKWREKDATWRAALYDRQRAPQRAEDRRVYAARILLEEGRTVRAYQESTPERRKRQKATSRAKRKATMTADEIEAQRKKDRERKTSERALKKLNLGFESEPSDEGWEERLDHILAALPDIEPPQEV